MEGFPGPQQQRVGGRAGQLREPGPGAYAEILRRRGARMRRFDRLRPRDDRGAVADQGGARKRHRELQVPRSTQGGDGLRPHRQQVPGRHRAVEGRQERSRAREDHTQHRLADHGQHGRGHRAFHAFLGGQNPRHARGRTFRLGAARKHGDACRGTPHRGAGAALREDRGRGDRPPAGQTCGDEGAQCPC